MDYYGMHKNIHFDADKLFAYLKSQGVHFYQTTSQNGYWYTIVIDTTNDSDDIYSVIIIDYERWGMEDKNGNAVYTLRGIKNKMMDFYKSYIEAITKTIDGDLADVNYNDGYVYPLNITDIISVMNFDSEDAWGREKSD